MALSKEKKNEIVAEVAALLTSSKLTVVAKYQGTSVKSMQQLRNDARQSGTKIKVVKNRLVKKALQSNETFKNLDAGPLSGQLLYAFNAEDEVAPAQNLNAFAKTNPNIEFVGAISADGNFMSADEVKTLAGLPGKNDLIAQVLATLSTPLDDVVSSLSGNLYALLDGIEAKASN